MTVTRRRLDDDPREVGRVITGAVDALLADAAWLDVARRARPAQWSDALERIRRIRQATALLLRYIPVADAHLHGQYVGATLTADALLDKLGKIDPPDVEYRSAGR